MGLWWSYERNNTIQYCIRPLDISDGVLPFDISTSSPSQHTANSFHRTPAFIPILLLLWHQHLEKTYHTLLGFCKGGSLYSYAMIPGFIRSLLLRCALCWESMLDYASFRALCHFHALVFFFSTRATEQGGMGISLVWLERKRERVIAGAPFLPMCYRSGLSICFGTWDR